MAKAHYEVVEHDGGWAYRLGDTYSETFATKAAAEAAAHRAAAEQKLSGQSEDIEFGRQQRPMAYRTLGRG